MTLKVGFAQAAAPVAPGTVDFTDANAGFASDVKAAIFFATSATANNTTTAHLRFSLGLNARNPAAATTQAAEGSYVQDAKVLGTTTTNSRGDKDTGFGMVAGTGGFGTAAVVSSWLSTGARLNFTSSATAHLINAILLGGDIEANVLNGAFANGTPSDLTLAHGLGGRPDILLIITPLAIEANNTGNLKFGLGFYDVATASMAGMYLTCSGGTTPTNDAGSLDNAVINNIVQTRTYAVQSVDATNVVIRQNTSNDSHVAYVLALRGTVAPLVAKVGFFTTETTTPPVAVQEISGMSVAPKAVLLWATRTPNTPPMNDNVDAISNLSFGAAISNSGGTAQGVAQFGEDDNVTTTIAKSLTSNSKIISIPLQTTGAPDVEADVSTWPADGVTFNYTNIAASAFQVAYLAFGQAAAKAGSGGIYGGIKELTGGMRG